MIGRHTPDCLPGDCICGSMTAHKLMHIKPMACCWICHATENAPTFEVEHSWLPEGWRRARRGFAGLVDICKACNVAGRRYRRDAPMEAVVQ